MQKPSVQSAGHRDRLDLKAGEDGLEVGDRRERLALVLDDLRQVVATEPHLRRHFYVEGQEDDPLPGDPEHLG